VPTCGAPSARLSTEAIAQAAATAGAALSDPRKSYSDLDLQCKVNCTFTLIVFRMSFAIPRDRVFGASP
jgi:hypothetical protein